MLGLNVSRSAETSGVCAAIRLVAAGYLCVILFSGSAFAIAPRALTGANLTSRPTPIDVSDPADWQVPHGLDPINGSQPGTAAVNLFRGDFTPQVPLAVLPARGGLAPELTLVYSPQRGETMLGSAWQFGFMSNIERRAIGGGTPDMYGVLDDPSADFEFRIDGALLVPNANGDGTYRSEHDAFTIYEPKVKWALVNRVVAWEVRRGGITRTYGADVGTGFCQAGVEYAAADCVEPVRWYLTRIENAHGNAIDITYASFQRGANTPLSTDTVHPVLETRTKRFVESRFSGVVPDVKRSGGLESSARTSSGADRADPTADPLAGAGRTLVRQQTDHIFLNDAERLVIGSDTHKLLPVTLNYNDGGHTISLIYENRPDVRAERQDGIERTLIKRVSRIDVKAIRDGVEHLAFRYNLEYQQAASDGRSLLTAVRQESVESASGVTPETILLRRFEYADRPLSDLEWDSWAPLTVEGESLVPDHYEFSDEMETKAFSSTSLLVNVDADAQPDLLVLNTDCEADPPEDVPGPGSGSGSGGGHLPGPDVGIVDVDKDVIDIPKTALSLCKSHHRVFLNEPAGGTGRKFVYDSLRSDQLNERLGPLQQVAGSVDYLIVDIDGNGIADLVLGNVDNSRSDLAIDHRFFAGSDKGWEGEGIDLPWAASLGGHDPFRELQLADVNADGKPDLVGDVEYFLNSGTAPFFSSDDIKPLQIYTDSGNLKNLPTDLPPIEPESKCMKRDASARFALIDLGIHRGFSDDSYRGTENVDDAIGPAEWVRRHTSYNDINGDGVADRVVALSWPEEAEIFRDIGSTQIWQDAEGRCGGVNRVYLGNGRGEFFHTEMSIGGLYEWYGGPRAANFSRNEVQTAPAVTFEYNPPINQQAVVDFDGDGREEMTQVCGTGWAHAIPNLGIEAGEYGLKANSTECPDGSVSLPAMWNGSSASLPPFVGNRDDAVLGGYFDVDGNGLADLFVAANPVNPDDASKAGGDQPYWRRSALTTPQSRLTGIVGPYGGRIELHWSVASDGGQGDARQLSVIGSIEGMNGRTDYRFGSPAFVDGRFMGFQTAEAWGTSGIVNVTQFSTDRRRLGAIEHEAVYAEDGTLYRLTVHLDRTDAERVALDPAPPFFNPVYRTCTFEFENDSDESDPASFIQECADFDGTEGPRGPFDEVIVSRSAATAKRPLTSLLRKREGDAPASPATPKRGGSVIGNLPLRSLAPGGDVLRARRTVTPDIVNGGTVDDPIDIFRTDNRLRVTEFDWDEPSGVLREERAFKDITTTDDTTVSTYTYHPWNAVLAVSRLHTRKTQEVDDESAPSAARGGSPVGGIGDDVIGTPSFGARATRRYFEYPLADYVGMDWGREIQWSGTAGPFQLPERKRSRTRGFSRGALVRETAWDETRVVAFAIDQCGLTSRRSTPLGWELVERDPICRETRKETYHGRRELMTYDGFHRIRSDVIDIIRPDPQPHRNGAVRFDYDPLAGPSEPMEVEIRSGASGSETIAKNYVDEFGRSWKRVVCERRAGASDAWSSNLEQAYPCATDPDKSASTIILYDSLSGLEGFRSLPFGVGEGTATLGGAATYAGLVPAVQLTGVSGTRSQHDRHGRLRQQTLPDGRIISYAFDVGRETSIGDGLTIDMLQRAVDTTVLRNGVLLNSTRVNAFNEQIEEGDALGNITAHGFDSWGRRISTTTPEAEVWESCQGPPVRKRATERATYSDNDEVLTITDALGNRITKRYDPHGRVTEIAGPDGVVHESRNYDDAFEPLILGGGPGPVIDLPRKDPTPDKPGKTAFRTRSVQTLDGMGNTYTVWIDALDRSYRQKAPDGTESLMEFDNWGREWRRTTPTGEIVTMTYDWLDRPVTLTVNSGAATATETRAYDLRGNLLRALDADGEVRLRSFDVMNRLRSETVGDPARRTPLSIANNTYDEYGRIEEAMLNGVRTAFRYDDAGRLVRKLVGYDPDARTTALMREDLSYTARDELESSTDKRGEGARSIFDELGRVVARETLFKGEVINRVETGYDLMGRVIRSVDELGDVTCQGYDVYSRVIATTPPGLGTRKVEYMRDAPHPVTGEPTHSLRTRITAPTGEIVDSYVDAMGRTWLSGNSASGYQQILYSGGRMTRSERIGLDGVTAAVKRYEYADRSHRVAREWDWLDPAGEAACLAEPTTCATGSVSFTYTPGGRQLSQTDAAGNATVSSYADDGTMLVTGVDAAGVTEVRFEYDATYPVMTAKERGPVDDAIRIEFLLDRYLHQVGADVRRRGSNERERLEYSYDDSGHRLSAALRRNGRLESRLSWSYDEHGRTKSKTYDIVGSPALPSGASHTIEWDYTPSGQLGLVTYPSGNKVSYRYDANGHLLQIDSGFGPQSTRIATFEPPDASGRYLSVNIGNDLRIKHHYAAGRESSRAIDTGNGVFKETYHYDALGRLRNSKREGRNGDAETLTLGYDARSLLNAETVDGNADRQSFSYTYDALGRRTTKVSSSASGNVEQTYQYGSGNRLLGINGDTQSATAWDAYGRPANDHRGLAFEWGLSDQLRAIRLPDGRREDMLFDADGQRIARTVDNAVDLFYSSDLSGDVHSQRRADGSYLDVVRDPNGGVVALLGGDGTIIPWAAGKGDTTLVAGGAGRSVQSAFGEREASDPGVELGFHQMWASALTPLRFAGVRVYDAETGRFLTPDPLGVTAASDPNDAADPFRYAHNNPVAVRDSTGYLGITPPTPTTIIVDGIAIETFNVNAWENGTIRVPNQAAYIAGVRAGIKAGLKAGWTLDEAVQYAIGNGPPDQATAQGSGAGAEERKPRGPIALGLAQAFANLFGRGSGAAEPVEQESETHAQAADAALDQAQGGGPANGHFINENGEIVRPASGVDPQSRSYWLYVDGPDGRTMVGADTREIIANFFAENPEYTPAGAIHSAGDVMEVEVIGTRYQPTALERALGAYWGVRTGFIKAAGGAVLETWNFLIHDPFWSRIAMARCSWGYSCSFQPKSGFWNAANSYMDNGHSYPGAIFNVLADGMFYGTFGAMEGIGLGVQDGDWERVGENTFALGATIAGAAEGGLRAGAAAPTTRSAVLGGIAIESSEATTIMMPRRSRTGAPAGGPRVVESQAALVEEILSRPVTLRGPDNQIRGVFFGPEAITERAKVAGWMDDGILQDALHIGGVHADGRTGFGFDLGGNRTLNVSATQLARAVESAAPGTRLTFDHLISCCAARPGGGADLFARLRGRPVLGYDELVGTNSYGRYRGYQIGIGTTGKPVYAPFPGQYMILLDRTGTQIGIELFQGMRSSGDLVP